MISCLHLAMCKFYSRLARQIAQLGDAAKRLAAEDETDAGFEERLTNTSDFTAITKVRVVGSFEISSA